MTFTVTHKISIYSATQTAVELFFIRLCLLRCLYHCVQQLRATIR